MVGSPAVLIVDDDPGVLDLMRSILEEHGYAVLGAGDGQEAMQLLREHPGIELLVTDLRMPGMSGYALAREALRLSPRLKILYVSGYPEGVADADPLPSETSVLVRKPFLFRELVAKVVHVLGGTDGERP